ncbi:DUF6279 family lipoprotein [Marinobacter sp.]|uniref:DUF6279 family lipoprotein n=1 Tax=Marinobacter sp. TaxID=50741 RepID=UPI00384ACFDB
MKSVFLRQLVLVILLVALAGCSSTRVAYRYADWGIAWWVEDYVTLSGQQESLLDAHIADILQWHCSEELPRYSEWLATVEADVTEKAPGRNTIANHQENALRAMDRLLVATTPAATQLLASLSDAQVAELERTMATRQQEKEEEFLRPDPGEERRERKERIIERAERWLGQVNEQQREIISQWNRERGNQTRIWLEGRARWQQALLAALSERDSPEFQERIAALIQNSEEFRGEAYQEMVAESRPALTDLLSGLLKTAEQSQKRHLGAELRSLRKDFEALTCQPRSPSADA